MDRRNELVKYRPPAITASGSRMDAVLARLHSGSGKGELIPSRRVETRPEVVDLQRVCAVHDRPYAARYVLGRDGRYRHAQTIRVTEALFDRQYAEGEAGRLWLDDDFLAEETCPWCGASGFGAVFCRGGCEAHVCYGKTVRKYFRCRRSCGHEGRLQPARIPQLGMTPGCGSDKDSYSG